MPRKDIYEGSLPILRSQDGVIASVMKQTGVLPTPGLETAPGVHLPMVKVNLLCTARRVCAAQGIARKNRTC